MVAIHVFEVRYKGSMVDCLLYKHVSIVSSSRFALMWNSDCDELIFNPRCLQDLKKNNAKMGL